MKKLQAFGYAVHDLKPAEIKTMFQLFAEYYANVSFEQFQQDLLAKDHVFVLKDKRSLEIKGFSTIVSLQTEVQGRQVRGLFSGDTVVHQDYWGQGALGVAFLRYLLLQKLRSPFEPLYWFLISKGYKTYLMMANNFKTHYPRYEAETPPEMAQLLQTFSETLYPGYYDAEKGIISFSQQRAQLKDCLKADVTPISDDLLASNARIAYFARRNPRWQEGDELACVALMTFGMPLAYQLKLLRKLWRKSLQRVGLGPRQVPQGEATVQ